MKANKAQPVGTGTKKVIDLVKPKPEGNIDPNIITSYLQGFDISST